MTFEIRVMHFTSSSEDYIFMVDASRAAEIMEQSFLELHCALFQSILNGVFIVVFYYFINVDNVLLNIE